MRNDPERARPHDVGSGSGAAVDTGPGVPGAVATNALAAGGGGLGGCVRRRMGWERTSAP